VQENGYPNMMHCSEIFLEILRKIRKELVHCSRTADCCVKSELSKYKTLPRTRLRNSVILMKTFMNSGGFRERRLWGPLHYPGTLVQ